MRRLARLKLAAWLTLATMLPSCGSLVSWNYYAPFRLMGDERAVSPVDPAEVHHFGVASRLHYLSITVDAVFFRNLPKTRGREVALGIDLNGALDKRDIKTVSDAAPAQGQHGLLFFERPFQVDPFLYRGLPLRLTLSFRDIGPSESANLRGRLASLGVGALRKIVPGADEKLKLHATQFEAFMGKDHKGKLFSYTFSLYPSDMEGVRQDLIVTGGRHVFLGIPSTSAPPFINKVKPADLAYKLRLEGRRLHWRHDGREYTDSPYVILSIIRYKRYPSDDTPLRQAAKSVDRFIEQENWQMARSNLGTIGSALLEEKGITQLERNLEQAWKDYRAARIDHGEAKLKSDKDGQLDSLLKRIKLLGYIGKDFQQILEPAEEKDLLFRAKRLARQAEDLARDLGKREADVKKLSNDAIASIKIDIPPPPPPGLKPPDVVKIVVTKPQPFYTRWWFYALVGVAAAGLLGGTGYAATRPSDPPSGIRFFVGKPSQ